MGGSGGNLMDNWRRLCRQHGMEYRPRFADSEEFFQINKRWSDEQIFWLQREYFKSAIYTSVKDFVSWAVAIPEAAIPDTLLARAYNTDNPMVEEMADTVQELRSAWFPDLSTERRLEELEQALEAALG